MAKDTQKKAASAAGEILAEADKRIHELRMMGNTITNTIDLLERAKVVAGSALSQVEAKNE